MFLASALIAVGGVWTGSASAAPIHGDMSLQGSGLVEQVQHHGGGHGGGGGGGAGRGGGGGAGFSAGRSGGGAGMNFSRGSGPGMSFNRSGGNFSNNRAIGGPNFATNGRQSFAARGNWNGRRNFSDFRHHRRGFRGSAFAFGFSPGFYDYGYDYGYDYPYDDGAYAYVEPGADSSAYCAQRFQSYDPSTGTYLGYDGLRHPCP